MLCISSVGVTKNGHLEVVNGTLSWCFWEAGQLAGLDFFLGILICGSARVLALQHLLHTLRSINHQAPSIVTILYCLVLSHLVLLTTILLLVTMSSNILSRSFIFVALSSQALAQITLTGCHLDNGQE